MKSINFIIYIILCQFSFAQIHFENFDDSLAQGYTMETLVGSNNYFSIIPTFHDSVDYIMDSYSYDSSEFAYLKSSFDDWLITPLIELTEDAILNFDAISYDISSFEVLISTTELNKSNFTKILSSEELEIATKSYSYNLDAYTGSSVYVAFRNISENSYGISWNNISFLKATDIDASITFDNYITYYKTGLTKFNFKLKHESGDSLYYADIFYQINNGIIQETNFDGEPLYDNSDTIISLSVDIQEEGVHEIKLWIDNVNHVNDYNNANDTTSARVSRSNSIVSQNILFEEVTGTWCAPCQTILPVIEEYSSYADIIPVAIHSSDNYETSEGESILQKFSSQGYLFPSAMFNRAQSTENNFPQPDNLFKLSGNWDSVYSILTNNYSPIEIILEHTYNPVALTGYAAGKIIAHADILNDLVFHLYLTEDSLSGGGGPQNHTLRKVPLGLEGDETLLANINKNDSVNFSYEYSLDEEIDVDNLNLIAFVETKSTDKFQIKVLQAEHDKTISVTPIKAVEIYGSDNILTSNNNAYFCNRQKGATYDWSVSGGANITHVSDNDNNVLIDWNETGSHSISVEIKLGDLQLNISKEIMVTDSSNISIYDTITNDVVDTSYFTDTSIISIYDTIAVDIRDTSYVSFFDTILINVFDTSYISITVSDTLLIDITITGISDNINTISIYPNPANEFIVVNTGNYSLMFDYELKIVNSSGQVVFASHIDSPEFTIPTSSIGTEGSYYIQILDSNGNLIVTKYLIIN